MRRFLAIIAAGMCVSAAGWACGPDFPNTFFVTGQRDIKTLPEPSFSFECRTILGWDKDASKEQPSYATRPELMQRTVTADLAEFAQAVHGRPDAEALVAEYTTLRKTLSEYVSAWLAKVKAMGYDYPRKEPEHPAPFDLAPFDPLLAKLPTEFALYMRGAAAYHSFDDETTMKHFSAVLDLPADQRAFRGVWAAFMLGKCALQEEPAQAIAYFERCRALVPEGARDSLGLAADSVGWQARAELRAGMFVTAMHRYVDYGQDPKNRNAVVLSLDTTIERALKVEAVDPALIQDPICRQLVSAWLISRSEVGGSGRKWLAAVQQMDLQGAFPGADRLAWLAYSAGDMTAAAQWAERSDPASPHATMVRAKLLLRDGEFTQGHALLSQLAEKQSGALGWEKPGEYYSEGPYRPQDDMGFAILQIGDYPTALHSFLLAGNWSDAAFVAERLLSIEELVSFVQANADQPVPSMRYILARRLARAGHWEQAIGWYPDGWHKTHAARYAESMAKVAKAEGHEKADHLLKAAQILRDWGMELTGTELDPDWMIYWGDFDLGGEDWNVEAYPKPGDTRYSPDLMARVKASATEPNKRFHYRYRAADLMWKCASLLPDNDVLTAQALYLGGKWLSKRDPQAADKFYKALVRRNPNLLVAQQADKLRWFPEEFTDTVVYQPLPKPWYGSKRRAAVIVLAAMAVLVLAGGVLGLRIRRVRAQKIV